MVSYFGQVFGQTFEQRLIFVKSGNESVKLGNCRGRNEIFSRCINSMKIE